MNYILEIRAFYDQLEINPLPPPAIVLWHALMHIANKTGWKQEFTVAVSVLELKTGLNAQSIKRARNRLEQNGLIKWKSRGGNRSACYQMISLQYRNTFDDVPKRQLECELQDEPDHEHNNKYKQNKTKQITEERECKKIQELYNTICVSFPRCTKLSDRRRRAVKARLRTYGMEEMKKVFYKAESSDFLKGKNSRNWSANFDWLTSDSNMVKVLDGNYDNKRGGEYDPATTDSKDESGTCDLVRIARDRGFKGKFEGF